MTLRASLAAPSELTQILPQLLSSLSISRGRIVLDQLQSAVKELYPENIVLVTLSETNSSVPVAAAIAIHDAADAQHVSAVTGQAANDSANLLHAGPCTAQPRDFDPSDLAVLSQTIDRTLSQRGVRFIQWAMDVPDRDADPPTCWSHSLGFCAVAQLQYLSAEPADMAIGDISPTTSARFAFAPLDWNSGVTPIKQFASLLQQTYLETLDCPRLAEFRSASQTIDAYQRSQSFAPHLWFTIKDEHQRDAGCLILADHAVASKPKAAPSESSATPTDLESPEPIHCEHVVELVYMGLIPSARGNGGGRQLLGKTIELAADQRASRLILAVDEANGPARAIYQSAGLQAVMRESVWVKTIEPPA